MTQRQAGATFKSPSPPEQGPEFPVPLALDFSAIELSDDQLAQLCADNGDLRIELTAEKELVIMPPAFPISGMQNNAISAQVYTWSKADGGGISYDSSAGFTFSNGAMRSQDTSWILRERWDALTEDELSRFSHIAADFVVELRSQTDSLRAVQDKMAEYIENGVRLGWLVDPPLRQVHVYRPGQPVEIFDRPKPCPETRCCRDSCSTCWKFGNH